MAELSDEALARLAIERDERAFAELIRRYEAQIVAVVRRHVADPGHAEDVFQETLLDAWTGLLRLRDPGKVRVWLLQIARNRCRDFFKSSQRHGQPTEAAELDRLVSRYGRGGSSAANEAGELLDALDSAPRRQREVARLFYLDGFTIAEISQRHRCPEGTVKRHLFDAREHVRRTLGIPEARGKEGAMSRHRKGSKGQPFPIRRPDIKIMPCSAKPFPVDFREGGWWFGIPEVGNRTMWAMYDPPGETGRDHWLITWVYDMEAVRPAHIHELDGVEINADVWNADTGWMPSTRTMYARMTDEAVEWIATSTVEDGKVKFLSYLDEGFEANWGPAMPRQLVDRGRFARQADGSYVLSEHEPGEIGAGMFDVTIGEKTFTCLRVIDVHDLSENGLLMEAFLTREGRTVLCRRYNGRLWHVDADRYKTPWGEKFPDHQRLVINGVAYVHWYDCLTHIGCGIDIQGA